MAAAGAAELYNDFVTALHDPRVAAVEDDPYAEPDAGVRVVERDEVDGGGCIVAVPPGVRKPIAKVALMRVKKVGVQGVDDDTVRVMLLINAEWAPGWIRMQRQIVGSAAEACGALIDRHRRFSSVVLHRHPKSHEGWKFRKWLSLRCPDSRASYDTESALALHCCGSYHRNYYAWSYLLELATSPALGTPARRRELVARVREWAHERPSDHSSLVSIEALHTYIFENDVGGGGSRCAGTTASTEALLAAEASFAEGLLSRRPNHESIWSHLRWLTLQEWLRLGRSPAARLRHALTYVAPAPDAATADPLVVRERAQLALWAGRYCQWVLAHAPPALTAPPHLSAAEREAVVGAVPEVRVG